MEERDGRLRLRVNTAGARYPVVVDPFVQVAQLSVSGGTGYLGTATAISDDGSVVVAAACGYNSSYGTCSTTVDANGSVYVFVEPITGWATTVTPTATLTAPDSISGSEGDGFGTAVAISGDGMTIVVSAPYHQCSSLLSCKGETYVYTAATEGAFTNSAKAILTPSVASFGDSFGFSLATDYSGSTILAYFYNPATKGSHVNLYLLPPPPSGGWMNATENAQLQSSDNGINFGYSLAISGDSSTIAAGSFEGDTAPGEAYVFLVPTATGGWRSLSPTVPTNETVKLRASDDNDGGFGYAVAVDQNGDTVVVGAPYQTDSGTKYEGEAYVFLVPPAPGTWGSNGNPNPQYETTRLEPNTTFFFGATFGQSVSISDDGSSIPVGSNSGYVYLFGEPSGGWPTGSFSNSSTNPYDYLPSITTETGDYTSFHGKISGNAAVSDYAGTLLVSVPGNNSDAGAVFVWGPPPGTTYAKILPPQLAFGDVTENTTVTLPITVMNIGSGPLVLDGVLPVGANFPFDYDASGTNVCNGVPVSQPLLSQPVTVNPRSSCTFTVSFNPLALGPFSGSLAFEDNAGAGESNLMSTGSASPFTQMVPLSGTSIAPPIAFYHAPTTLNFGNVTVNTSVTQTVQLQNTGAGPLILQLVGWVGGVAAGYTNPQIQCDYYGILTSLPVGGLTMVPGSTCFFTVQFNSSLAGSFSGGFVVEDNAGPGQSNLSSVPVGNSTSVFAQIVSVSAVAVPRTSGDYDGDGKADLGVWRPSTGQWFIVPSNNPGAPITQSWGLNGDIPVRGDFDGDGTADFAVWRPSTGQWFIIRSSNPGTTIIQSYGLPGDIPVPGDYDGDGITDFAVWRPSTGQWFIIPSSNPGTTIIQSYGLPGDIPVPGDYDGDKITDFAVWRPTTGQWFIIPSSNPGAPIVKSYGLTGDIPVPGDYDGDGITDLAVWRPTTGQWFIIPSSNPGSPITQSWGLTGDIPVPVDYDGDGKTDVAIWRPSTGQWWIIPSSTPMSPTVTPWGLPGDIPVQRPIGQ